MADFFTHFSCVLDVGTPDNAARALNKWFVYQSTGKHDELKTPCFQRVMKEGKEADDIQFLL
ncbi:hypothetical protein ACFQU1_22335 [Chelatococcus sp. GCM10030263]|uniref:hypothetical protein n=1 Tax=Chelatococcus sp. GCM10030263 TaxID=3273387 RepID=UPI003617E682